jgi:YidC/Oxa1 family membrane protein insertase
VNPWHWLLDSVRWGLTELHQIFEPLAGIHAWGWSIIGLTVIIRIFLVPIAVKQFRSMRAMQALAPEMQKIKKKYKVDRELLKKDPEKYREKRQKMNEEVMGLYKEHGVNPAASCLPLLLQAPIFIALFRVLQDAELELEGELISQADFYVFGPLGEMARADIWGWVLILLMVATMFITQKQMMGRTGAALEGMQAQQQKIMLYGMPVFLGVIAQNLPIGVLLYWVTTNLWQLGQQGLILREVKSESAGSDGGNAKKGSGDAGGAAKKKGSGDPGGAAKKKGSGDAGGAATGNSNGKRSSGKSGGTAGQRRSGNGKKGASPKGSGTSKSGKSGSKKDRSASPQPARRSSSDHLPRRPKGGRG